MTTTEAALRDALARAAMRFDMAAENAKERAPVYRKWADEARAALSQPSPASSTAGEAYELGYRQAVIDGENSRFLSSLAQPLSPSSGEPASGHPDNTYTPYGRRSVSNLAKLLGIDGEKPTVVSVINKAYDEIVFLRALAGEPASVAVEAEAYLVERIVPKGDKRDRSIVDAKKYDASADAFWVSPEAKAEHRITPLSKPTPVEAGVLKETLQRCEQYLDGQLRGVNNWMPEALLARVRCDLAALSETLPPQPKPE